MADLTEAGLAALHKTVLEVPDEDWTCETIADINKAFALAREGLAAQWRPIETAPKDGTPILAWFPGSKSLTPFAECVRWRESGWKTTWNDDVTPRPSHWMPLPRSPK